MMDMRCEAVTLSWLILISYLAIGCIAATPKSVVVARPVESKKMDMDTRISELASQIAKSMTEQRKSKIAVIEFTDLRGNVTDFGRFLAEKLITKLFATGKFQVMERAKLKKALEEQRFGLTGMVDDETAARLGKILGVEAIVIGTVTDLGSNVDVNSRLIGTETGAVFAVASTQFEKSEAVAKLMGEGIGVGEGSTQTQPAQQQPTSLSPKAFENNRIRITIISLEKTGNIITLTARFENIWNRSYKIRWNYVLGQVPYLLDENGANWDFKNETIHMRNNSVELIPSTKLLDKFTFGAKEESNGKKFDFVLKLYLVPEGQSVTYPIDVLINDIQTQ